MIDFLQNGIKVELKNHKIALIVGNDLETNDDIDDLNYYIKYENEKELQNDNWYDDLIHRKEILRVL